MIRLIVNADDLGSGPGRDRGIFRAFREGLVTSASLLANGATFDCAAAQALAFGLPVGVHLNLSEGIALSGPIPGLTDCAGRLPGKKGLRRILSAGRLPRKGARQELRAQMERVIAAGVQPDHIDTHQHFALFPDATPLYIDIAREFGIGAMRLPRPMEPAEADPEGDLGEELLLYRRLAPETAAALSASGFFTPDGLWGMPALDRLNRAPLARILEGLPDGTWELMTHPGEIDSGVPFSGPPRAAEAAALTDPEIGSIIHRRGIRLTSFGECRCDF